MRVKIFWEFVWNFLRFLGEFFEEFFQNSSGILREFFGNSLGILLEFFGDVWLGGFECVGVDFGQFDLIRDLITNKEKKTITRSAS